MLDKDLIEIEELKEDILDALEDGDYEEAEDIADEAIEMFPKESFGYFYMGEAMFMQFDYDEALHYYIQALEIAPESESYLYKVALAHAKLDEHEKSKDFYKKLLEINNNHVDALISLGVFSFNDYQFQEAIDYCSKALESDANATYAYQIRSLSYEACENYKEAISDIEKCIELEEVSDEFINQKINLLKKNLQFDEVKKEYTKALSVDSPDNNVVVSFADFLFETEDYKSAEKYYTMSIDNEIYGDLNVLSSFLCRANARYKLGKNELAFSDYLRTTELDSNSVEAFVGLANCKVDSGEVDVALDLLNVAQNSVNKENRWLINLKKGDILKSVDIKQAEIQYQNVIDNEEEDNKAEALFRLGNLFQDNGNLEKAYECWKSASEIFHLEADEKIEVFCSEFVEKEMKARESELLLDMQEDFKTNSKSKILNKFFNAYWIVDIKKTTSSNKFMQELPADIEKQIIRLLAKICVVIRPEGIMVVNPDTDGVRMVYKIDQEDASKVTISGIPLNAKREDSFTFSTNGTFMVLRGFGDEDADIDLYLSSVNNIDKLSNDISKDISNHAASGNLDFMGQDFLKSL